MHGSPVTRRTFMRACAGGALGGGFLVAFPGEARPERILAPEESVGGGDEEFWELVRGQFSLQREPLYLNTGTMGPSPYVVQEALRAEMELVDRTGRYGGWDDVRTKIARFVMADPEEISLTHNVTEGINVVACGLPLRRGDEVILTTHEHAGNALPWLARARRDGIVIKAIVPGRTAAETLNRINDAITRRTRAIAVPHVTCTIGQVLPGKAISALGHEKGLWVMLDAAHTPGLMPLDVHDLGCDFLSSCGHKWIMGPKGTGFLVVRKSLLEVLEPYWAGGGCDAGWDVAKGTMSFRNDAHRFDFGSQSAALSVGFGAAIDFLSGLGMDNVARRTRFLAGRIRAGLESLGDRLEILTPSEEGGHAAIVGFRAKSVPFDKLQQLLREKFNIITRAVPENGVNCNRVSTHIYNSPAEVERFLDAVRSVA